MSNRKKRPSRPDGKFLTADRVMWGIVTDGEPVPEMLIADRKYALAMVGALPESQRAKVTVARVYVTVRLRP